MLQTTSDVEITRFGQTISLSLTLPDVTSASSATLSGEVAYSEPTVSGTNVVFVVDTSTDPASKLFDGAAVGDQNGNGIANEVIDAQILAIEALVSSINLRGLGNINTIIVPYGADSDILFSGTAGADDDGNGVPDVADAARTLEADIGNDPSDLGFILGRILAPQILGSGERVYLSDGSLGGDAFYDAINGPGGRVLGFGPDLDAAALARIDPDSGMVEVVVDPSTLTETFEDTAAQSAMLRNLFIQTSSGDQIEILPDDVTFTDTGFTFTTAVPLVPGADDAVTLTALFDDFSPVGIPLILETTQIVEEDPVQCTDIKLSAPSETVTYEGGKLILGNYFDVNSIGNEQTSDTLLFTFDGTDYALNTTADILRFVSIIENDGRAETDALYYDNDDLALVFDRDADGGIESGVLFVNSIGRDRLTLDRLMNASADSGDAPSGTEDNAFCTNMQDDMTLALG